VFIGSRLHRCRALLLSKQLTALALFAAYVCAAALITAPSEAFAKVKCKTVLSPNLKGANFLVERDQRLALSPLVNKVAQRHRGMTGIVLQKPSERVAAWLDYLEEIQRQVQGNPKAIQKLKEIFYNQYVIRPEQVPESYFSFQIRLARERGYGAIAFGDKQKLEMAQTLIEDQKSSLDSWIDYLISEDSSMYPIWAKYWMLTGVVRLSKFDVEQGGFGNRTKDTVGPFPELDREALALVMDAVVKKVGNGDLSEIKDPKFLQLLEGVQFGKMYGYFIKDLREKSVQSEGPAGQFPTNDGHWIVYKQGSDPAVLVRSLQGRNTGWCTAGEATAKMHLGMGDFHVYYSFDANGEAVIPRLAIRMEGNRIAEVRGVAKEQHVDSQILSSSVLSEKMKEFGQEGDRYSKKEHDMRLLTEIDRMTRNGLDLSREEIIFLYEVKETIEGFGYGEDPRINEIKSRRNSSSDMLAVFDGAREFTGDVRLPKLRSNESLQFPEIFNGSIDLSGLTDTKNVRLPRVINGNLNLSSVQTISGLKLPEIANGTIYLNRLGSAKGRMLRSPKGIKSIFLGGTPHRGL
jgi:hypothetical protein